MIDWESEDPGAPQPATVTPTSAPTPPSYVPVSDPGSAAPVPTDPNAGKIKVDQDSFAGHVLNNLQDFLNNNIVSPIGAYKAVESVASRLPLGWIPGGADDQFKATGEWIKQYDPESYPEWEKQKLAAEADFLHGGNLKADFNLEARKKYDEWSKTGTNAALNPHLALGAGGVGSVGGAFSAALQGLLPLPSQLANRGAAAIGLFGQGTDRLQRIVDAYNQNPDQLTNPAERHVAELLSSGKIDEAHAVDLLIREGAGYSENPWVNLGATALIDPQTWTPIAAARIAKAGVEGAQIVKATTNLEKFKVFVHEEQAGQYSGRIWQFARATLGMDPLGAYAPKPQAAAAKGVLDMQAGVAVGAYRRAYNPVMVTKEQQLARELGIGEEFDQALGRSATHQNRIYLSWDANHTALLEDARIAGTPEEYADLAQLAQEKSQVDRAVEFITQNKVVPHGEAQLDDLAARMATMAGISKEEAAQRISKMSEDSRAVWYDATYNHAYKDLEVAKQSLDPATLPQDFPLDRMVLMNDNTLDVATLEALTTDIKSALEAHDLTKANFLWDEAASKYAALGSVGTAPGGEAQLKGLLRHAEEWVSRSVPRAAEEDELATMPTIADMLGRHTNDGKPLYRIGFRPTTEDAWGLRDNPLTGRLMVERQPEIARLIDPLVMPQKFYDPLRNSLGQIIGTKNAARLTNPIESASALFESMKDNIGGRRLYLNWTAAFERNMAERGIPKNIAREIFDKVGEVTRARMTTIRAAKASDVAKVIEDIAAEGKAIGSNGNPMSAHDITLALLEASKGDFRIVGLGTGITQRMRNMLIRNGIGGDENLMGEFTITQYLNFRYRLNPLFGSQRALEGPYYAVVYGTQPVGRTLPAALKGDELMLRNLGSTTVGRDFALDAPEMAVRSNFGLELADRAAALQPGLKAKLRRMANLTKTVDPIVRNNMIALSHSRMGLLVEELLDDVATAEARSGGLDGVARELGVMKQTMSEISKTYAEQAGKNSLTKDEVGVKYIQELFSSSKRMRATENGIDVSGLVHESKWMSPSNIGELDTLHPENIAVDLGYQDLDALRKAVTPRFSVVSGRNINPLDMPGLANKMRANFYHPDVIKRLTGLDETNKLVNPYAYFNSSWGAFWDDLARPVGEGGLDISAHAAKPAQDVIRAMAKAKDMEPWEYLSAVVGHNVQGADLKTTMGQFAKFLQGEAKGAPLKTWIKHFNDVALQQSGARALVTEYEKALPGLIKSAEAAGDETALARLRQVETAFKNGEPAAPKAAAPQAAAEQAMEEIPHDFKVAARATTDATQPVKPGQKPVDVYHYVVGPKTGDSAEQVSSQTYATAQEAIDAGQAKAQELATAQRKALGEATQRPVTTEGRAATRPVKPLPEGFTENPNVAASGHSFPMGVKRDGLFHVTTNRDAVLAEGFQPGKAEGIGSKGDVINAGRVSILTDSNRAATYEERLRLAVDAAQGRTTRDGIIEYFKPLYQKAYAAKGESFMESAAGDALIKSAESPEDLYKLVQSLDGGLVGGSGLSEAEKAVKLTGSFDNIKGINPDQITTLNLATREKAVVQKGLDTAELTLAPEDVTPLSFKGQPAIEQAQLAADKQAWKELTQGEEFDKWFEEEIVKRIKSGKQHSNPNIEAIARGLSEWTKTALGAAKVQGTRRILKDLAERVPTEGGVYWNRSEALVHQLARTKIQDVERDVFRLTEMQTERSAFSRSFNHPIFGFYPASYMWGKVFPESVKFLTKSPYGITYDILKTQMLIAAQRDMSPDFEKTMHDVDRSAAAFLLGYLTPSLPWEEQQIRLSPSVRAILENISNPTKIPGELFREAIAQIDPGRWVRDPARAAGEVAKLGGDLVGGALQQLQSAQPTGGPEPTPTPEANKGPVKGTELEPVLVDSMTDLSKILGQ